MIKSNDTQKTDNMGLHSLHCLDMGLLPVPLAANTKVPLKDFELQQYLNTKHSYAEVQALFENHDGNIGVACNYNNLVVLDFDNVALFAQFLAATYPPLLNTKWVKTRRGVHIYYRVNNCPSASFKIAKKLDVKCSGYVVAPPSIVDGHTYSVTNNVDILTIDKLEFLALDRLTFEAPPSQKPVGSSRLNTTHRSRKHKLIHEIKDRMTIIDALGHAGDDIYVPRNSKKNYITLRCPHPLHEDRHPSFQYFFKDERVYCNTIGCKFNKKHQFDQIDTYRIMNNNMRLDDALQELGDYYGLDTSFLDLK